MSEVVTEPMKIEPTAELADELVSKKVLEEFKADFFKEKEKRKALEADRQRLLDEKALREKDELIKNEQWKQLYETEKSEKLKFENELKNNKEQYVTTAKVNAVMQLLGGLKKDSYSKYIDTSKIEVREDGTLDQESIRREADRYRQEYAELLNVGPASGKMPSNAPSTLQVSNTNDLSKMSTADLTKLAIQQSLKGK